HWGVSGKGPGELDRSSAAVHAGTNRKCREYYRCSEKKSSNFFFIGQQFDARVAHCDLVLSDWCHSGFFAETRRNLGSFRSEHQVLAAAIASRPRRRQETPLPKSN